ncbi:hypothetical protein [Paracoccus methylarcula]|uniref:hypothetical protein n=1 Tax=Paracoccus methylarcula TaxID=72022 RepID=UPI0011CDC47C|nr:hypothetical protein [Paracoccus methylarcula]
MTRLTCIVPGCRRTRGQRKGEPPIRVDEEWICGEHWPTIPVFLRRRKQKLAARYRRAFGDNHFSAYPPGSQKRIEARRLSLAFWKAWNICKRAAIERAMWVRCG